MVDLQVPREVPDQCLGGILHGSGNISVVNDAAIDGGTVYLGVLPTCFALKGTLFNSQGTGAV